MMKTSMILSFLLCWSFVLSNPHYKKPNDKSADELNHVNNRSDSSSLTQKESSNEASSGKDWGGNFFFVNFLNKKDPDNADKNDQTENKTFFNSLVSKGSKFFETLADPFGFVKWAKNKVQSFGNFFTNKDRTDSGKTEELNNRTKRDLGTSTPGDLRANPHRGGISENVLKLSQGSTSNVLKSEKATVAESLNGRAAINRILAQAKAKAAKAAQHKTNLFDSDNFSKWLLSGSSFDMDIFKHPFHLSPYDAKMTRDEAETTDDSSKFSLSRRVPAKPEDQIKHTYNALSDSAADGTADAEHSYAKLSRESEHQEYLSPKLQITSAEERGHGANGMHHKPTVSHHTHRWLSHEDAERTGLRHASSHAHAPHMRFYGTEDEEAGDGIPEWKHAKWMYTGLPRDDAFHASRFVTPDEFETSDGMFDEYGKEYTFKSFFEPGEADDENVREGYRRGHEISANNMDSYDEINLDDWDDEETHRRRKLKPERHYYDGDREDFIRNEANTITFDNTKNRHFAGSAVEHTSPADLDREENIRNKNKPHNRDGVQRSAIYSAGSAETEEGVAKKQSGNMLITKISTGTPTRKPENIDIERYHSRDQSVAADSATSLASGLSDEKGSKHTNNVPASPSVDDVSVAVKTKTGNERGAPGETRPVINNDATSAEIEMSFSGIKSHPSADLPLAHSPPPHVRSETHPRNQKVHQSISGYEGSAANALATDEAEHSTDGKTLKNQNENYDLRENQEVTTDAASTAEATTLVKNQHQYDLFRTLSSKEEDYVKARRKHTDSKGRSTPRHKTSIEVIDIGDDNAKVVPQFSVHKFGKEHASHDANYDEAIRDDQEIETDESIEDAKKSKINHDDLEEEKFAADEKSKMTTSNEHRSHDQREKSDGHDQHNYRSQSEHYRDEHNHDRSQYDRSTHNQHSQHNHHAFNQHVHDMTSSSTMSDGTEYETWNKHLHFIREQERENNEAENNASLESSTSVVKKSKKQNNAMDKQILLDERGKKHMTDEDNYVNLKKHKSASDLITHSTEINEIASAKNAGEEKIRNDIDNQSENRKILTHAGSLIRDSSTVDTTSQASSSEKTINNNNQQQQRDSWESTSLEDSRADVRTETERVYGAHGRNENVDISAKQTADTTQSADSESNFQQVSKTSAKESDNAKKTAAEGRATGEKISSNRITNEYRNHDNLHKTSASSKSFAESQAETKDHSNKNSKNSHEISTSTQTITGKISSSDVTDKSRSDIQNTSSKSSAELQTGSQHNWNNLEINNLETINKKDMNIKTSADVSADASISVGLKNRQESILENTSSSSKSAAKSEVKMANFSNDLKNTETSAVNSKASSEAAAKSSVESGTKTEQKSHDSKNVQINANAETSRTAMSDDVKNDKSFSSSEGSQVRTHHHSTHQKDSQINAISQAAAESIFSNTVKNEDRSHLQESSSSSSAVSSGKVQTELEHNSLQNNLQNSEISSTAETSAKSTFSNTGHSSVSSQSSSSSKSLEDTHVENKHHSNDMRINRKKNFGTTSNAEASSNIVENNHQGSISSLSSSDSFAKSQIENKNTETSAISNNLISDTNQHNSLHATSSSQTSSKNDLTIQNNNQQTFNKIATSTHINDDNHEHEEKKNVNNKNTKKDKIIKEDSEDSLNAAASVKTTTSTNIKNIQNSMAASSSSNSQAKTWAHSEHDLNRLKEGRIITDNSVTSKTHLKHDQSRLLDHTNKIENNYNNKLQKVSSLSDSHSTSEKSENVINKITRGTTFNKINNVHQDNLLKGASVISGEKTQADKRLENGITVNTGNSGTENEVNSRIQIKNVKDVNKVLNHANKILNSENRKSTIWNNFNSENRNSLKSFANLHNKNLFNNNAEIWQKNNHKLNTLSNAVGVTNVDVKNKIGHNLMSSVDTKTQSKIDHNSNILGKKVILNSETRNNINKWLAKSQAAVSSSSHAESQDKKGTATKTEASAKSIANSIDKNAHENILMHEKSLLDSLNIIKVGKEHRGDQKAKTSGKTLSSNISGIKYENSMKKETSAASQLQQHNLNAQEEDKIVTSNILSSTKKIGSSEMRNARQDLLEKAITSSNSRAEVQHEQISDIVKESSEVAASAAKSAQTALSGKVESESREKLIRDSTRSDSYAKSQMGSNNDLNVLKKERIIASAETSANSAASGTLENEQRNKLDERNSLSNSGHDTYMQNEKKNVLKHNLANAANAIVSTKETNSGAIKDEQSGVTTAGSSSYLRAGAQTEHEYNSGLRRGSIETTFSSDAKDRVRENKNNVNDVKESLTAATNSVTSANAISSSSSSIENISKQDLSKVLSSSNSYIDSQINNNIHKNNIHSLNVAQSNQESTDTWASAASSADHREERKDNFMRKISHADLQNQKMTKTEHDSVLKKDVHNCEDAVTSEHATSSSNIKNKHQNNLLEATSLVNSFAETQNMQEGKSNVLKGQHLIITGSTASSNSKISDYMNSNHKNNFEKSGATSSSNSYAKSSVQNVNNLEKSNALSSSNSYAKAQIKNENISNIKKYSDAVTNAKAKTTSYTDIKGINSHNLFNLLANGATKTQAESKKISQEDVIKKGLSETSLHSFLEAQNKNAYNSKILENNFESSAIIDRIAKINNQRNQQEHLHKTEIFRNTQDSQHDVKSMSSANSYVMAQDTNEDIAKSEKTKENGEVTVNLLTLGKTEAHNKVKEAHPNDWLVATSSTAALAEARTQNKDKFDALREAEEVAVSAGAATSNNIERHGIHAEDSNNCQDSWSAARNVQDAVATSDAAKISALKGMKNKKERKITDKKIATSSSNDAHAETQMKGGKTHSVSYGSESFVNTEETQHAATSAESSAFASTSDNVNTDLSAKYDQINNKMTAATTILKNTGGEKYLSSIEAFLHPSDKINRCNKNVETREFISEATSLYKMLNNQRGSEVLLMKKNPKGPVQIASLKNSVPPLIAYRLIPREVYERIRTIIMNKQTFCTDCQLSNS